MKLAPKILKPSMIFLSLAGKSSHDSEYFFPPHIAVVKKENLNVTKKASSLQSFSEHRRCKSGGNERSFVVVEGKRRKFALGDLTVER